MTSADPRRNYVIVEDPTSYRPATPILNWQGPKRSLHAPKLQLWMATAAICVAQLVILATVGPALTPSNEKTFLAIWISFSVLITLAFTFLSTSRHLHQLAQLMQSINTPMDLDLVVEKLQAGRFSRFEETWKVQVAIIKMFCRLLKFHHGVHPVSGQFLLGGNSSGVAPISTSPELALRHSLARPGPRTQLRNGIFTPLSRCAPPSLPLSAEGGEGIPTGGEGEEEGGGGLGDWVLSDDEDPSSISPTKQQRGMVMAPSQHQQQYLVPQPQRQHRDPTSRRSSHESGSMENFFAPRPDREFLFLSNATAPYVEDREDDYAERIRPTPLRRRPTVTPNPLRYGGTPPPPLAAGGAAAAVVVIEEVDSSHDGEGADPEGDWSFHSAYEELGPEHHHNNFDSRRSPRPATVAPPPISGLGPTGGSVVTRPPTTAVHLRRRPSPELDDALRFPSMLPSSPLSSPSLEHRKTSASLLFTRNSSGPITNNNNPCSNSTILAGSGLGAVGTSAAGNPAAGLIRTPSAGPLRMTTSNLQRRTAGICALTVADPLQDNDRPWTEVLGPKQDEKRSRALMRDLLSSIKVGQELSKVPLPAYILEPRSLLEKLSDLFVHPALFAKIAETEDPIERLIALFRWFLSGFHVRPPGPKKPYNPILGETFECTFSRGKPSEVHFLAEQVSHHPPASVLYAVHTASGMYAVASFYPRSKIVNPNCGASIGDGLISVYVPKFNECYRMNWPSAYAHGLLSAPMRLEIGGVVKVASEVSKVEGTLEFIRKGWFSGTYDQVKGFGGYERLRDPAFQLAGDWTAKTELTRLPPKGAGVAPSPKGPEKEVLFDTAAEEPERPVVANTTFSKPSRAIWSTVTKALREGDSIAAQSAKEAIEISEREIRRAREARGEQYFPQCFRIVGEKRKPSVDVWKYVGPDLGPPLGVAGGAGTLQQIPSGSVNAAAFGPFVDHSSLSASYAGGMKNSSSGGFPHGGLE